MSDDWEEAKVRPDKHHYTAEVTTFSPKKREIQMNLLDKNGLNVDDIQAYRFLESSRGFDDDKERVVGIVKDGYIKRLISRYFFKKDEDEHRYGGTRGIAIPKVMVEACRSEGLDRVRLLLHNGDDELIAHLEVTVDDLLEDGAKFWGPKSEKQYYLPLEVWEKETDDTYPILMKSYLEWKDCLGD